MRAYDSNTHSHPLPVRRRTCVPSPAPLYPRGAPSAFLRLSYGVQHLCGPLTCCCNSPLNFCRYFGVWWRPWFYDDAIRVGAWRAPPVSLTCNDLLPRNFPYYGACLRDGFRGVSRLCSHTTTSLIPSSPPIRLSSDSPGTRSSERECPRLLVVSRVSRVFSRTPLPAPKGP